MKEDLKVRTALVAMQHIMESGIEDGTFENKISETHLTHHFTPVSEEYGCAQYAREAFIPAGTIAIGKLHKLPHLTFLLKGHMIIVSENGGRQELRGPTTFVSPAGSKRAFHILEDSILTTVHVTKYAQEQDVPQIEEEVISPTYAAMGLLEPDTSALDNFLSSHLTTVREE